MMPQTAGMEEYAAVLEPFDVVVASRTCIVEITAGIEDRVKDWQNSARKKRLIRSLRIWTMR